MKKLISIITMQLMAAAWITATAATYYEGQTIKAKTTEGVEMSFYILDTNAKTCAISWNCIDENTKGKITVPSYVEGFKVVEAKNSAFYNRKGITSVELPYTLTKMGGGCFGYCESLTEVSLPANMEEMGISSFYGCKSLKSVAIPSKITSIKAYTFEDCESLASVKFPSVIDSIYYSAFENCKSLESVVLPSTVKYIDSYAFYNCTSLTTITGIANIEYLGSSVFGGTPWYDNLPNGMTYLGKVAFKYVGTIPDNTTINIKEGTTCIAGYAFTGSGLVGVTIPESVTSIGTDAFGHHAGLNSITVAEGNKVYDSRDNCNAIIHTATNTMITGCNTTVIPTTVKALGYDAFMGASITSINIPDGVDSLANDVFWSCPSLKSVTIGKGVRKIGTNVFTYCYNLADIVVSSANPYFDSRNNCKGIVEKSTNTLVVGCMKTVIPSTVTAIGNYAFRTCNNGYLYTVTIPDQIEKIGDGDYAYTFAYNSYMRSVTIGHGVKEIGGYAFYGCNSLKAIHALMDTPCEIKDDVFRSNISGEADSIYNHATLYVPIGSRLNYQSTPGWNKFKHIVETDGSTLMDGDVFTAETVENHTLTYQVTSRTKKTCELIGSPIDIEGKVTIPTKAENYEVTGIGDYAFYASNSERNLTSVTFPDGITYIGDDAFAYNENLVIGELPSSLERIGNWAFVYCKNSSLNIPAKVKTIGRSAFCGWNDLTTITVDATNKVFTSPSGSNAVIAKNTKTLVVGCKTTIIPEDVECIGEYAFNSIWELKAIDIPSSVAIIETCAFNNTGLKRIDIPETVRSIAEKAFRWCNSLTEVYSLNPKPFAIPDLAFNNPNPDAEDTYKIATLYVPRGTKAVYQATDGWKLFENIEESDFGVETATINGVDYMLDSTAQTATVKLIHDNDNADVDIPETVNHGGKNYQVTAIADSVFCDPAVRSFQSVTFPVTIKTVAERAFWRYNPTAIVWNSETRLPSQSFTAAAYKGRNFLLYVPKAGVAPSGVESVIVNGVADEVVLREDWPFYCPQDFTATKISFTHDYTMQTGYSSCAGWETVALPFDVATITHETKGQLVPFAAWKQDDNRKPFWLYSLSSEGFVKASSISADTPYIISMPNNDVYPERFNLPGKVTFAATNATVRRTNATLPVREYNGGRFWPNYTPRENTGSTYALNAPNARNTYSGAEVPGSVFLNGGGIFVSTFGAYVDKSSSARTFEIVFANEDAADVQGIIPTVAASEELVKVYSLSGQLVGVYGKASLSGPDCQLPAGIYIVDGKKVSIGK